MVSTSLGSVDIKAYISEGGYKLTSENVVDSQNSFTNYDGSVVNAYLGRKNVLGISLEGVPMSTAESIATEIHKNEFTVTYTNPLPAQDTFHCTSYSADCDDGDPSSAGDNDTLWNISMTLESVGITVDTSAESL